MFFCHFISKHVLGLPYFYDIKYVNQLAWNLHCDIVSFLSINYLDTLIDINKKCNTFTCVIFSDIECLRTKQWMFLFCSNKVWKYAEYFWPIEKISAIKLCFWRDRFFFQKRTNFWNSNVLHISIKNWRSGSFLLGYAYNFKHGVHLQM